jgi:hypothetical protein
MQADEQYRNQTAFFNNSPPLDKSVGFIVLVGSGIFFTTYSFIASHLHNKYNNIQVTSEYFSTANRSIGLGLATCGRLRFLLHIYIQLL